MATLTAPPAGVSLLYREPLSVGASGGRVKFTCLAATSSTLVVG